MYFARTAAPERLNILVYFNYLLVFVVTTHVGKSFFNLSKII